MCRTHAKDSNNDARSSNVPYGSPACQRGDLKSSVPTLEHRVASELLIKQLTSKSFKKTLSSMSSMFSGLMSRCNTPAACKPVTACNIHINGIASLSNKF